MPPGMVPWKILAFRDLQKLELQKEKKHIVSYNFLLLFSNAATHVHVYPVSTPWARSHDPRARQDKTNPDTMPDYLPNLILKKLVNKAISTFFFQPHRHLNDLHTSEKCVNMHMHVASTYRDRSSDSFHKLSDKVPENLLSPSPLDHKDVGISPILPTLTSNPHSPL